MFGDVRFVCMGGTPQRMKSFAEYMLDQLDIQLPTGTYVVKSVKLLVKMQIFVAVNWISTYSQALNFLTSASAPTGQP